jgi:ribosomal protein S12 methylthiotransferase
VGFPGETDQDFEELLHFVETVKFERAGVFVYSREEGTPAFDLPDQVPARIKKKRLDILMRHQQAISKEIQRQYLGKTCKVLIDEKLPSEAPVYLGRSEYDAPEVDGVVYVHSSQALEPGDFLEVKITETYEYDLTGETFCESA